MNATAISLSVFLLAVMRLALPLVVLMLVGTILERVDSRLA